MKKGFTIIELLVASLLLGMLVTILTMVFNQSSIAWRTGVAKEANMDMVRDGIAQLRDEADNTFVWKQRVYRHIGLWDEDGNLRKRACNYGDEENDYIYNKDDSFLKKFISDPTLPADPKNFDPIDIGQMDPGDGSAKTYTVNVKSAGPDRVFDTYDDIWSWPDDFE